MGWAVLDTHGLVTGLNIRPDYYWSGLREAVPGPIQPLTSLGLNCPLGFNLLPNSNADQAHTGLNWPARIFVTQLFLCPKKSTVLSMFILTLPHFSGS